MIKNKPFLIFNLFLIIVLISITFVFWITTLDIDVMYYFILECGTWSGRSNSYLSFFYYPMNAILFTIPLFVGFPILLMSFSKSPFFKKVRYYRNHGIFLIVVTLLGAGLFNSVLLKAVFSRPRPYTYFDGSEPFYRPFEIAFDHWFKPDMSFPSGHVSMGFVLITFFFAFYYAPKLWQKLLKWGLGVVVPLFTGISMIVSRMSFGEHYMSDGIWAAAFVYFFALGCFYLLKIPQKQIIFETRDQFNNKMTKTDLLIVVVSVLFPILFVGYIIISHNGLTTVV